MATNFKDQVRLFMIFDILGDTLRSGPLLWKVNRKRLEDVKNHTFDLILMYRMLRSYLPSRLNDSLVIDYMIIHDLPEAITGDITKFEGISDEERSRVTDLAIQYLIDTFNNVLDFKKLFSDFEEKSDLEAKIVSFFDAVHSSTTFLKYSSEGKIDSNNPNIIPELLPYVELAKKQNKDIGDIFYDYHRKRICFSEDECKKYGIEVSEACYIETVIKDFMDEFYKQKLNSTLLTVKEDFPKEATKYRRV